MPGTKIINIQKSDSFEEIERIFSTAEATEVIFIFPRGTIFANQPVYFEQLKKTADQLGKKISIVTSDHFLVQTAAAQGITILQGPSPRIPRPRTASAPLPDETVATSASDNTVGASEIRISRGQDDREERYETTEEPDYDVELAAARLPSDDTADKPRRPRVMRDIVRGSVADHQLDIEVEKNDLLREELEVSQMSQKQKEQALGSVQEPPPPVAEKPEIPVASLPSPQPETQASLAPERWAVPDLKHQAERELTTPSVKNRVEQEDFSDRNEILKLWSEEEKNYAAPQPGDANTDSRPHFSFSSVVHLFLSRVFLMILGGAFIILALILYVTLGSASLAIKPHKQDVDLKFKVSAGTEISAVDAATNKIPGQKINFTKEESGDFEATGQKDVAQKASGKVTIYNKGASAQKLVATTRLQSQGGLIFRIPESVTVPPATGSGSGMTPGKIESRVYADRPGAEYNVAPGNFTIPGFKDTPSFALFYATSTVAMSGGSIGPSKVVTQSDYVNAQKVLTDKLTESLVAGLKNQAGDLTVLDNPSLTLEKPTTNVEIDQAADKLHMSIAGSADVVAFRGDDIHQLVAGYLSKTSSVSLTTQGLDIFYSSPSLSATKTLMTFDTGVQGRAAAFVDSASIRKAILGMNEAKIRLYFKGLREVESVKIVLSPFWVKSIPRNPQKVKITVEK